MNALKACRGAAVQIVENSMVVRLGSGPMASFAVEGFAGRHRQGVNDIGRRSLRRKRRPSRESWMRSDDFDFSDRAVRCRRFFACRGEPPRP
jgi:hypothetical protein